MSTKLTQTLEAIARAHLGIETLETRKSDSLDFHDCAVWTLEAALLAAYWAGRADEEQRCARAHRRAGQD